MTIKDRKAKVLEYKDEFGETVKADMRALHVYRPEYEKTIEIYADMLAQYRLAWEEFVASGCRAECKTKAGGVRKTAALTTMEELRRQIGAYADRLCLTPKTKAEKEKTVSKLEEAMGKISKLQNSI